MVRKQAQLMCVLLYVTEVGEPGMSDLDYVREVPLSLGRGVGAWVACDPYSVYLAPRRQRAA